MLAIRDADLGVVALQQVFNNICMSPQFRTQQGALSSYIQKMGVIMAVGKENPTTLVSP
jgi:hypothetical protein